MQETRRLGFDVSRFRLRIGELHAWPSPNAAPSCGEFSE